MPESTWGWQFHRLLTDQLGLFRPFSRDANARRILFLSEPNEIASAQLFPFFLYRHELASQHRVELREFPLRRFLHARNPYNHTVDAVCFQTSFDLTADELDRLVERIKATWPNASLAYFDWFAPTDLRYAEVLAPHVAAYVKKQVLRDFTRYGAATLGDTNLTDYYAKRYHIDLPETSFTVPPGFQDKLVLGSGFEYSPNIIRQLRHSPSSSGREIDLHARVTTKGTDWYTKMRAEAQAAADNLSTRLRVANRGRVSYPQYMKELRNAKLCFSPFGYGEICWRDFEAMSTGSALLKPDLSHLRLANDLFKPYETYVPLQWELDDLQEKVFYFMHRTSERIAIAHNAFEVLSRLIAQKSFLRDIIPLWKRLSVD